MLKKIALVLVLASAGIAPAMAQGAACTAPAAPAAVDVSKATVADMRGVLTGAQGFVAASDVYQACLEKNVETLKAAATKDKPFDPAIEKDTMAKVADNQAQKQKVGDSANAAITAFKKAHNCDGKLLAACQ